MRLAESLRWMWAFVFVAGTLMGCSDNGGDTPVFGPERADRGPGMGLAKAAVPSMSMHRAVVVATVTRDGAPVEGVDVAFSRSVSGQSADYMWMGTTDAQGMAEVEITAGSRFWRVGASGYYTVRATGPASGDVAGRWGSVPINGGDRIALSLPIGEPAHVTSTSPLSDGEEFMATLADLTGHGRWEIVDYSIGVTNPASGEAHSTTVDDYSRRVYKNAAAKMHGAEYPQGAIIVKETFTWEGGAKKYAESGGMLAMVKRGGGFNPAGNGWEWIALAPDMSRIAGRGGAGMMDGMCNACHMSAESQEGGGDFVFPHPAEYAVADDYFTNYREWTKIDVVEGPKDLLGRAHKPDETRHVYKKQFLANPDTEEAGYPVGTVLVKEVRDNTDGVIEITAMVKRGGGFNVEGKGWEWFMLSPEDRSISGRGANLMGGGCANCHSQALDPANGMDYVFKHRDDPFNN